MEKQLYGGIYIKERKILLCKTPYSEKITIPLKYEVYEKFEKMLKNEYGIFPFLTKLLDEYNVLLDKMNFGIHLLKPYILTEYPEYQLKEKITIDESGEYTEKQFCSFEQAKELYNIGKMNETTMILISQLKRDDQID